MVQTRRSATQKDTDFDSNKDKSSPEIPLDKMCEDDSLTLKENQAYKSEDDSKASVIVEDFKSKIKILEEAVAQSEPRIILRVTRKISQIRKQLTPLVLSKLIDEYFEKTDDIRNHLLQLLGIMADEPQVQRSEVPEVQTSSTTAALLESQYFVHLLVLIFLYDQKRIEEGVNYSNFLVENLLKLNRRTMDHIEAKLFFYYVQFHQIQGTAGSIRPQLLHAYKLASLNHETEKQAVLLTSLLRIMIDQHMYEQADRLISKTKFPTDASNAFNVRYCYYIARVKAIQLNYSESHDLLVIALRKAPRIKAAGGFLQEVSKLNIVVELLMGDIPDRALFYEPMVMKSLMKYRDLVQAVRVGDLSHFTEVLQKHQDTFKKDRNYSLILRLRHSVIKTGIRMISMSYKQIYLKDVCAKLSLESSESAEYIVAKAIKDGVIDAEIDHENGIMKSRDLVDVYSTEEPLNTFHDRIRFCLDLHNESVKAMQFPLHAHKRELENADAARRRFNKELTQSDIAISEGLLDQDDDYDGPSFDNNEDNDQDSNADASDDGS